MTDKEFMDKLESEDSFDGFWGF